MKYHEILKKHIDKSNLTLEKISEECAKYDLKIHPTYISKLRLGKRPPASYKVTVVLAKILGIDPELLLAAGRNEEAEHEKEELKEALEMIYPDLDGGDLFEKMMQIYMAYHNIINPPESLSAEEEKEYLEYFKNEEEKLDVPGFINGLADKKLTWGEEELSESEKQRAIEVLKIMLSREKGTV